MVNGALYEGLPEDIDIFYCNMYQIPVQTVTALFIITGYIENTPE